MASEADRRDLVLWPALSLPRIGALAIEWAVGAVIFGLALAVYNATLTPSLSYMSPDGNELATIPYTLGLAHSTGYPLYTWAGKVFTLLPIGDVAHRVNLMSAFGAAGGCSLLFASVLLLIRGGAGRLRLGPADGEAAAVQQRFSLAIELGAAAFGALLLAYSRDLWSQAVIAEVYAPNVFMVALTFYLLLRWARAEERRVAEGVEGGGEWLFAMFGLSFGLSIGTHMSNLALAAGFVPFILLTNWRLVLRPRFILVGALAFALGVMQFAWLPYKASNITDAFTPRNAPTDLHGIYNYTLNAFPQIRWAFPLSFIPDRIDLYFGFLKDNVQLAGALVALLGAWLMLFRHPRAFFLFMPAYVAQMAFFLEYRANDIDVFFITSHFLVAVFAAYGMYGLLAVGLGLLSTGLASLREGESSLSRLRARRSLIGAGVLAIAIAFAAVQPAVSLAQNWHANDQSANTGINDFYRIVFQRLPEGATLSGQGGVFGYDMFYYRYVYDWRPDITIPATGGAAPNAQRTTAAGIAPTYSTIPGAGGFGFGAPGGLRGGETGTTARWYWPLLASPVLSETDQQGFANRTLTLYEARSAPLPLFTTQPPANLVGRSFGNLTLAGYEVGTRDVEAGGTVHLKLYWQGTSQALQSRSQVSTRLGETKYAERHDLGFGNAQRYIQSYGQPTSATYLVEEYDLVILSSTDGGKQALQVRVGSAAGGTSDWLTLTELNVEKK